MQYTGSYTNYKPRTSNSVKIGEMLMGGEAPIRIQTMTNTSTQDVEATVQQCIRSAEKGAELIRITVPSVKDVPYLQEIKNTLRAKGYTIPVVADIHFSAQAAIEAAKVADKIRINPGNYYDKKKFETIDYTAEQYKAELDEIEKNLRPLLWICTETKTPIRIGVNHGSLSDRIMSRYGDTPEGMAESAMEFLRICAKLKFTDLVISMKASNTRVMVFSTRLLASKMQEEQMNFPIHLGVTEAGDGDEGRIKSAAGIGTLLQDGIGETIRVSLTEDPEFEIPVAQKIVAHFNEMQDHSVLGEIESYPVKPFEYNKILSEPVSGIGGNMVPQVLFDARNLEINENLFERIGWNKPSNENWVCADISPDILILPQAPKSVPENKKVIVAYEEWKENKHIERLFPIRQLADSLDEDETSFIEFKCNELSPQAIQTISSQKKVVLILSSDHANAVGELRLAYSKLINANCKAPVLFKFNFKENEEEKLQVKLGCTAGPLLIDGFGDGICISNDGNISYVKIIDWSFTVLQACRVRTTKTEYISCPGCGRTLFELQDTTQKIKARTSHLKNLKIGVMGCIVNGPGEMADADYGYVGAGPGKISLYKSKTCVKKNIPQEEALEELISLIKENGDWVDS
jgi:(E)-4-hydroxy-3-methylbut-2-enyl-diphosphate synthase